MTFVVDHGDDLLRSEEDLELRRSGIGAVRMDCETPEWIVKSWGGLQKEAGASG
jgi:hypothetical protein